MDDESDDADAFAGKQAVAVLPRDPAPDGDRDGDIRGPAAGNALAPVVHLDFVDAADWTHPHPADILDLRVWHVAVAVSSSAMVDARTGRSRGPLKAQGVAEWARHVEVDVRAGIPRGGDLHQACPVATAIVDDAVTVVVERVARLLGGIRTIARDLFSDRARHDGHQGRQFDDQHLVGLRNFAGGLAGWTIGAPARAREQQHQTGDR